MVTTIQIQDKTWEDLNKRRKRGETFDDVIRRGMLEVPEENENDNKK